MDIILHGDIFHEETRSRRVYRKRGGESLGERVAILRRVVREGLTRRDHVLATCSRQSASAKPRVPCALRTAEWTVDNGRR